jgi:hypothetical protein
MVREGPADGPRGACSSRVLARLLFQSVLVLSFGWKWFRTVAAAGGQSAGAWRTVRVLPADGPLFGVIYGGSGCFFGRSAEKGRTARVARADGRPHLAGWSARACVLCSLVRFLPSFFRASACVSRNHS